MKPILFNTGLESAVFPTPDFQRPTSDAPFPPFLGRNSANQENVISAAFPPPIYNTSTLHPPFYRSSSALLLIFTEVHRHDQSI